MRPFRFRLESLLQLREEEEQQAALDYAQARQHREEAERALRDAMLAATAIADAVNATRQHPIGGHEQVAFSLAGQEADAQVRLKAQSVREATAEEAQAWQRLVERRRQTGILQQLKEKQRLRHETASRREEQKLIDEAATIRYAARLTSHETVF